MNEYVNISPEEYRRNCIEGVLCMYEEELQDEYLRFRDPVRGAVVVYFPHAIEALVLGLEDIGRQYLFCARECIDRALTGALLPWLGWDAKVDWPNWDDEALDYHWALAYESRYKIDCGLEGTGNRDDLDRGIEHIERLILATKGLSGPIQVNRLEIVCTYLWLSIVREAPGNALDYCHNVLGLKTRVKTVTKYRGEKAYLHMLYGVAHYVNNDKMAEQASRASLKNILLAHQDIARIVGTVYWPTWDEAFKWAWLWECVFRDRPDPEHAIGLLQGTADFEESA